MIINDIDYLLEFIDDFPIGIARNDTTGKTPNHYNKYLLEMFGWELSDIDTMQKWFSKSYPDDNYRAEVLKIWTKKIEEAEANGSSYSEPMTVRVSCKDGSFKWCEVRYYRKGDFVYGTFVDVTDGKILNEKIEKETQKYRSLLNSTQDGFWIADMSGNIVEVNQAYSKMSGYEISEIKGSNVLSFDYVQNEDAIKDSINEVISKGHKLFDSEHKKKSGEVFDVEVSVTYSKIDGGLLFCLIRDISKRKLQERISKLRDRLSNLVHENASGDTVLQSALDVAESMTKSNIGFFHFVDDNQEEVSLQVWSTNTLEKMCFMEGHSTHYPISQAGVWVDCIHQKKAVIYNDYNALPHKKGLPEGHAPLLGFISVPIMKQDKIVAIVGMGNKDGDYTQSDVEKVEMISEIALEYYDRLNVESKIEYMAYYDVLTGLPNRELLSDRLSQAIAFSKRTQQEVAICYLDLDNFKPVNDKYGHDVGDKLLKVLANRFNEDLREGDTISRIGGDEFILVLAGFESKKELKEVLKRIVDIVNIPFDIDGHRIHVSCSIGVTVYPIDDSDTDTLMRHADQAMYEAKENGKSSYYIYAPVIDAHIKESTKLKEELANALEKSEIVLHFQPKIDLKNGKISGFEALSRWIHPHKGMIYPNIFIPVMENTPLEIIFDEWLIKEALDVLQSWHEKGYGFSLSINISPRHLQLNSFAEFLEKISKGYAKEIIESLEIEVLEVATVDDISKLIESINRCKELGVSFSLDDFGTGYASLTHFHLLPVDILKIDQNFVKDIIDNSDDYDIVKSTINLAKTLNRPVVAEGAESIESVFLLMGMGSDYVQGYGIAKPMRLENVDEWIIEWSGSNRCKSLREYEGISNELDINVAIFSHDMWLRQLASYIDGSLDLVVFNEESCQFEKWYKGLGKNKYGDREIFPFLQAKHHQIHQIANKIHELMMKNEIDASKEIFKELKEYSEELKALIRKMEDR